ncbi:MAG: flagellar basal body rod protein FlgB [Synergistaceae bacterium]|nr:flagellar basal body rod protein FlgB [Synergistota bacterium]NLM70835.1 flagellar basal body rod protein FlgB [Synergistaceae bacterium]
MMGDFNWKVMEKTMEGLSKRFEATSRNLANANTPEYGRRNVSFEDELRDLVDGPRRLPMTVTNEGHIPSMPMAVSGVIPLETRIYDEKFRLDGNNVDPEREMAVMSQTRMAYNAMTRFAAKKSSLYRLVIGGR